MWFEPFQIRGVVLRRTHPCWRLLASDHASFVVSFLHAAFIAPNVRSLPEQEIVAKLDDYLFHLRAQDPRALARTALQYLETWADDAQVRTRRPGEAPSYHPAGVMRASLAESSRAQRPRLR